MNYTDPATVQGIVEREKLDAFVAHDMTGQRKLHYLEATPAEVNAAIAELLTAQTQPFTVTAWRVADKPTSGGRKSDRTKPFDWTLRPMVMEPKAPERPAPAPVPVNGSPMNGEAWQFMREMMERMERRHDELSERLAELSNVEDDEPDEREAELEAMRLRVMERGADVVERVLLRVFPDKSEPVNGAAKDVRGTALVNGVDGVAGLDRDTLVALAQFAKTHPKEFAQYRETLVTHYGPGAAPSEPTPEPDGK